MEQKKTANFFLVKTLGYSVVWGQTFTGQGDGGREGAGRTGHRTLLPAVSSLTFHFLPADTNTGTAAITAQRLREH